MTPGPGSVALDSASIIAKSVSEPEGISLWLGTITENLHANYTLWPPGDHTMRPVYRLSKYGRSMLVLLLILTVWISRTFAPIAQERRILAWSELARTIVSRLSLEPGERVIIIAHPDMFQYLVPHLCYEIIWTGGANPGVLNILASSTPIPWETGIIEPSYESTRAVHRKMFQQVNAGIMRPGAVPAHPAYAALQDRFN